MSGLTVQTGPWRNSTQTVGNDRVWSGGRVKTGNSNSVKTGNSNRRQIIDPDMLSGFSYDRGFSRPSPYAIPSVVYRPLKEPTQVIKKKKINYLKQIANTLLEQKELAMKQAGHGIPIPPMLPLDNEQLLRNLQPIKREFTSYIQRTNITPSRFNAPKSEGEKDSNSVIPAATGSFHNNSVIPAATGSFHNQPNRTPVSAITPPVSAIAPPVSAIAPPVSVSANTSPVSAPPVIQTAPNAFDVDISGIASSTGTAAKNLTNNALNVIGSGSNLVLRGIGASAAAVYGNTNMEQIVNGINSTMAVAGHGVQLVTTPLDFAANTAMSVLIASGMISKHILNGIFNGIGSQTPKFIERVKEIANASANTAAAGFKETAKEFLRLAEEQKRIRDSMNEQLQIERNIRDSENELLHIEGNKQLQLQIEQNKQLQIEGSKELTTNPTTQTIEVRNSSSILMNTYLALGGSTYRAIFGGGGPQYPQAQIEYPQAQIESQSGAIRSPRLPSHRKMLESSPQAVEPIAGPSGLTILQSDPRRSERVKARPPIVSNARKSDRAKKDVDYLKEDVKSKTDRYGSHY